MHVRIILTEYQKLDQKTYQLQINERKVRTCSDGLCRWSFSTATHAVCLHSMFKKSFNCRLLQVLLFHINYRCALPFSTVSVQVYEDTNYSKSAIKTFPTSWLSNSNTCQLEIVSNSSCSCVVQATSLQLGKAIYVIYFYTKIYSKFWNINCKTSTICLLR